MSLEECRTWARSLLTNDDNEHGFYEVPLLKIKKIFTCEFPVWRNLT